MSDLGPSEQDPQVKQQIAKQLRMASFLADPSTSPYSRERRRLHECSNDLLVALDGLVDHWNKLTEALIREFDRRLNEDACIADMMPLLSQICDEEEVTQLVDQYLELKDETDAAHEKSQQLMLKIKEHMHERLQVAAKNLLTLIRDIHDL